jgi:hypothetical protein
MGLFKKSSWSAYDRPPPTIPNPDPKCFQVKRHVTVGDGLVVEVHYPNCTNYEGRKVLLYVGVTIVELLRQGSIDPHFCDNTAYYSPIARFEPTETGWALAEHVAGLVRKGGGDDS